MRFDSLNRTNPWRFGAMFVFAVTLVVCFGLTLTAVGQTGATPGLENATLAASVPPAPMSNTPASSAMIFVPESSVYRAEDAGKWMHTNYVLRSTTGGMPKPMAAPDFSSSITLAETPASMGCVYKVGPIYAGCDPSTGGTNHPTGGWGVIVIVDAFDNPTAASDLATFDATFGIPAPPSFTKVYANGNGACTTPPPNAGWALEEALDVEWAHAMAPNARIVLVEACSNSGTNLYYAETVAGKWAYYYGGGQITNSWGGGEYSGEVADDVNFYASYWSKVAYFASAGDSGCGAQYPSSSPWVVSAGGTRINRNADHSFANEACWSGSGGGISAVEQWDPTSTAFRGKGMGPWSAYQYPMFGGYLTGAYRHTPDLSFNADPASGVYVYSGYNGGWFIVGGTSVSSPALAGIVNLAGRRLGQAPAVGGYYTNEENNLLYDQLYAVGMYAANFYDVTTGTNGCSVGTKWDYCTGVGSPRGLGGK